MPKPSLQSPARFNVSMSFFVKPVKTSDIVIDVEISKVFSIQDKTLEEIRQKVETFCCDKSQPVLLINGENILVDGHRHFAAAKEAEQHEAAGLLINHFLKVSEKKGFYSLLPESVRGNLVESLGRLSR